MLLLSALLGLSPAFAGPTDDAPATLAVQNRLHIPRHEFSVFVGTLPLDAFTKGLTFSGGYTVHFGDIFAWEVGQFTYSLGFDTKLNEELLSLPQPVAPTPFEIVNYYVTSNAVFNLLYGKSALLNRGLVRHEVYALAGVGVGWMTLSTRPVVDVGLGWRIFAGKNVSFKLEGRDLMFIRKDDVHNELWLGLGINVAVGK